MISEEQFLDFECPACGDAVSFPAESAGRAEACPMCNESLIVPAAPGASTRVPLPIETSRLRLRRLRPGDWKDLLELLSDEELFRFSEGEPLDEPGVLAWLERDPHVRLTTPNQPFCLALERLNEPKVIGYATLEFNGPDRRQAAFNLLVGRPFQRQGYGLEAADALLGFCFQAIHLHRVFTSCDSRNAAARHFLERLGLRQEGEFIEDKFVKGEWVNSVWYAALAREYQEGAEAAAS